MDPSDPTLDCHYKLKICALKLYIVALCSGIQEPGINELPATTELDPLLIYVIHIFPRYVVGFQEVVQELEVMLHNSAIETLHVLWVKAIWSL